MIHKIDLFSSNYLLQVHDIAADVDLMKTYCSIIAPSKYVLGVDKVKKSAAVQLQVSKDSGSSRSSRSSSGLKGESEGRSPQGGNKLPWGLFAGATYKEDECSSFYKTTKWQRTYTAQ